jgi:hypothetical protein
VPDELNVGLLAKDRTQRPPADKKLFPLAGNVPIMTKK